MGCTESRGTCIVCLGNPGAGKSTLLNSFVCDAVFSSGFSPGCGLTKKSQTELHRGEIYVDTPGLACSQHRQQAAEAIAEVLRRNMKYKLIFVITLEAGHVRPQDFATVQLVLESIHGACAMPRYAVIVNKATVQDIEAIESGRIHHELSFEGWDAVMTWLEECSAVEDKSNGVIDLPRRVLDVVTKMQSVHINPDDVIPLQWNKYESLKEKYEAAIQSLTKENIELVEKRDRLIEEHYKLNALPSESTPGEDATRRNMILELAHRGIELYSILDFYGNLGHEGCMPHFDPKESTTSDVVNAAIIPMTKNNESSYSELVRDRPRLARRMVTHNWGNLFSNLVAAVVADALDLPKYKDVLERLAPENLQALMDDLANLDKLHLVYWACPFCVNQHHSICHSTPAGEVDTVTGCPRKTCTCTAKKFATGAPQCEMDKFDRMMHYMLRQRSPEQVARHVIAIDGKCALFKRAWVIAELVVTADLFVMAETEIEQKFRAFDEESLQQFYNNNTQARGIDIRNCEATNPDDKKMILHRAENSIAERDSSFDKFNKELNEQIFRLIGTAQNEMRAMEKVHVLCIGNTGVGTTTIVNSMIGSAVFVGKGDAGRIRECVHNDMVFMEAQGLADSSSRQLMAKTITKALRKDGTYKIFFVVTLESGRVRPQDKDTIASILKAVPIQGNYSVIINKATSEAVSAFRQSETMARIAGELLDGCLATEFIRWVEKSDLSCSGLTPLPFDLLEMAPSFQVKSSSVRNIDGRTAQEMVEDLQKETKELESCNAKLRAEIENGVMIPEGYCQKGCGRKVAPGLTRSGKPYNTCCRSCVEGFGHDSTCMNIDPSKLGPGLCKHGCGRAVGQTSTVTGRPMDTCCRSCARGRHDPDCGRHTAAHRHEQRSGLCKVGCGRPVAISKAGGRFDTCCRGCAIGKEHSAGCLAGPAVGQPGEAEIGPSNSSSSLGPASDGTAQVSGVQTRLKL